MTLTAPKVRKAERDNVLDVVGSLYNYTHKEILSRDRPRRLAEARHCAMTILRLRGYTLQAVAQSFERADHATIMHAVNRVRDQVETDQKFAARWDAINKALEHSDRAHHSVSLEIHAQVPGFQTMPARQLLMAVALQAAREPEAVSITIR